MNGDAQAPSIVCEGLSKSFRSYEKEEGLIGSIRSFFHRQYKTFDAVSHFSFEAQPNEIIGLLGPNGAGKTTLIKMLTGIIVPSSGEAKVLGHIPHDRDKDFRKRIALVMGQKSQLWWDIPAYDSLQLLQRYYELDETAFKKRIGHLAELFQVERLLRIHVRRLSLGERMKMELMASLLHEPDVIFLDEPTIGLDLIAQSNIREFLKEYHREHRSTIILTSHYMADVAALADRIVLILDGQKRFDGTLKSFESFFGQEKFARIEFRTPPNQEAPIWEKLDAEWSAGGKAVDIRIPECDFQSVCQEIFANFEVCDLTTEQLPIERVMTSILESPYLLEEGRSEKSGAQESSS